MRIARWQLSLKASDSTTRTTTVSRVVLSINVCCVQFLAYVAVAYGKGFLHSQVGRSVIKLVNGILGAAERRGTEAEFDCMPAMVQTSFGFPGGEARSSEATSFLLHSFG